MYDIGIFQGMPDAEGVISVIRWGHVVAFALIGASVARLWWLYTTTTRKWKVHLFPGKGEQPYDSQVESVRVALTYHRDRPPSLP